MMPDEQTRNQSSITALDCGGIDLADAAKKTEISQRQAYVTETDGVTEQTEAVTIQ
jgi:hypothetical protein